MASRIWAFQRPLSTPQHPSSKGGWESARHAAGMRLVLLIRWHTPSVAPCSFLSSRPVHIPQAIDSHGASSWPPALYFNHKSPWQASKHISAQLLSPGNNMSVDAELFTFPVTKMAISVGFCQGGAPASPEVVEQPAPLLPKASLGTVTAFSNYHIGTLSTTCSPTGQGPCWLAVGVNRV